MKQLKFILILCSIVDILQTIRPGAQWTITDNDPSTLIWASTQTVPSNGEIQLAIASCKNNLANRASLKRQASIDVKNQNLTQAQRFQALLILEDLDQ